MNLRRWLTPGIGVKRWLLVTFAGTLILALGVAHVIRQATQDAKPGGFVGVALDAITLQFLPYWLRGLVAHDPITFIIDAQGHERLSYETLDSTSKSDLKSQEIGLEAGMRQWLPQL